MDGQGALGDPCSLGAGTRIAAEWLNQQPSVQAVYPAAMAGIDYTWAVGGQYGHLESGARSSNNEWFVRSGQGLSV